MLARHSLFAASAFLAASSLTPASFAQERSAHEQQARDIYANVVAIRSARGQAKVPEVVDYLVGELKAAGFSDDDLVVTDYDSKGEPTQGLVVWYRAEGDPAEKPIVLLAHMDVVDALAEDWVRDPFTLTEEEGYFFGRGTAEPANLFLLAPQKMRHVGRGFKVPALPALDQMHTALGIMFLQRSQPFANDGFFEIAQMGRELFDAQWLI